MLYQLYRVGSWSARHLPLWASYRVADCLADLQCLVASGDRRAVQRNLAAILGPTDPKLPWVARQVFRNFAKYLVDFFRLELVDDRFVRERVTLIGREHVEAALKRGRGAILLTAHVGNYELGAAIANVIGFPLTGIALKHQDPRIEAFFTRQRESKGFRVIPVGMALRRGFACLRRNELLGIVADRDFFDNGIHLEFLSRTMSVPKGPAMFSVRTGAPLIPTFLVREPGDRFQLIFESPIEPAPTGDEARDIETLTRAGLKVLETYIRRFPTQWYLFRDFDNLGPWVIL